MNRRRSIPLVVAIAAGLAWLACSEPDQPASVVVLPHNVSLASIGQTFQLSVQVSDKAGKALTGTNVSWTSANPAVATVDGSGRVTAVVNGTTDVTASAGNVSDHATVTVAQVPAKVDAASGAQQTGTVGQALAQPIVLRVRDSLNAPVSGVAVAFSVSPNGGTVSPQSGSTGADGQFAATWTLGTKTGTFQVTGNVTGASQTASFNATANPGPANNLSKVSGDNQFAYMGTRLAQLVAVRVRDQYGNGIANYAVQFATDPNNGTADSSIAFADTGGVARSGWVMPNAAVDTVHLRASAVGATGSPLLGSPATFTAISHNVRVTAVSPTTMTEGQSVALMGDGFDAGNTKNVVTIDGINATVRAATANQLTVTVPTYDCKPARSVAIQVTVGGLPAAPVNAPVNPASFLSLAVGQQAILTDPTKFCFQLPAASGQEGYLIGVQSTSEAVGTLTPISLVATAAAAPSGAVARAPALAVRRALEVSPASVTRLQRWMRHRQAELRQRVADQQVFQQMAPAWRAAPAAASGAALVDSTVKVDDTVMVRVQTANNCASFADVKTVVRANGKKGIFLEDVANPVGGYAKSQFIGFAQKYDSLIYKADTLEYGSPLDIDHNGRIVVVVTKEVNKRGGGELGFTTGCDNFPRDSTTDRASNYGEFFYLVAPDPGGTVNASFKYSTATATQDLPDLIAHESVHVIQFGRRLAFGGPFPDIWIAEGQAVMGEEVAGDTVEGRTTGQNYGLGIAINFGDTTSTDFYSIWVVGLGLYFGWDPVTTPGTDRHLSNAPWECSWLAYNPGPCVGGLDPYGGGWAWMRYLSDRFGPTYAGGEAGFQRALIDNTKNGYTLIQSVAGVRMDTLLAQWAAMLYVDDRVANAAPALTLKSWNLYDIFYGTYTPTGGSPIRLKPSLRLTPVSAGFTSVTQTANVRAGSAYYAVLSGSNRPASAVKARDGGGGILNPNMRYWIVRTQ
jgi:hypothetical protein